MAWINEFHYDNAGADAGEYIEIAGAAGTSLAGWQLVLYNGNPSQRSSYATIPLTGTIADQSNGFGTLSFAFAGIQNGAAGAAGEPDGIALVDAGGTVVEFISYEGSFTAANGPAAGLTSTNVGAGIFEDGATNGTAIGRIGTGDEAGDFTFALISDDTPGAPNVGQSFVGAAATPSLSIGDLSIVEGDDGTSSAIFTVTLSAASTSTVTVDYASAEGTATSGSDFIAAAGSLSFAPGVTEQTFSVAIVGDTAFEADEAFTITLSNPANATLGDANATGTITNDDAAPVAAAPWINEFHYDNAGADAGEYVEVAGVAGTDLAGFQLLLYNGNPAQRSVYATINLTGVIADQSNGFGTVSFAAAGIQNGAAGAAGEPDGIALYNATTGQVIEFISYEGSFTAASGPAAGLTSTNVGAGIFEDGASSGTAIGRIGTGDEASDFTWALIADDTPGGPNVGQTFQSPQPQVAVSDVSVVEGNDGTVAATFTITRSGPTGAFSIGYATADGTALAGSDYAATAGTLNFAEGQETASVTVLVNGDTLVEPDEAFFLNLTDPAGAAIADGQGQATIVSDEPPPFVSIGDVTQAEGDSGQTAFTFTVTRSAGTSAFSVDYIATGGTATVNEDYAPASGTLSFAEGELSREITVLVNGDTVREANETFEVRLFNPTDGALLTDATGLGTILNDELTLIHDVQGSAYFSPILAENGITTFNTASTTTVTIQAVVTAIDGDGTRQGFYLTEESDDWDASLGTSEGIFVMLRNDAGAGGTLASLAPGVQVGDLVTVSAQVMEYQAFQSMPRTVLVSPTAITEQASGLTLPTLTLDASHPIPNAILTGVTPDYMDAADDAADTFDFSNYALSYFETIEGMLVTVPDMVVGDGFVSLSGGQPFFKAYSTVHADPDQINDRGGYTIAGDPPLSPPDTIDPQDDTQAGGRYLHDGDVNPDVIELDFTDFAIDAPAGLTQTATMGDKLGDVTGILDFDFTDVKLFVQSIDPAAITNAVPVQETTALGGDARALTIATFNVENLDPGDVTEAQTAAKEGKFYDLARAIVNNLNSPDILTIEEIQDNNGAAQGGVTVNGVTYGAADASITWGMLVSALNEVSGETYQWVDQEPVVNAEGGEPGGNIRVGFLYNTGRVQLGDLAADASLAERRQFVDRIGDGVRDAGDLIAFSDDQVAINTADWAGTRKSLLGEFSFAGNNVYAVANHLPSKGGSGEPWQLNQNLEAGQPANGAFAQRSQIAEDLYGVLDLIETNSGGAGIVSGGDYNDFYFYRPLEAVTGYVLADGSARIGGSRFENLTLTLAEAERYTYTFDGRSQAIDHIVANGLLGDVATYDVVHINTGYNSRGTGADANPRLSDHDPALSSFDFRSLGETLRGTAAGETIEGFGGDDTIFALGGNDIVRGGEGDDILSGGAGNDTVDGGAGNDLASYKDATAAVTIRLGDARARNTIGAGSDALIGIEGVIGSGFGDTLYGDAGANSLFGLAGDDRIVGGAGGDLIVGGAGLDRMTGGLDADIFAWLAVADFAVTGFDTVDDFSRAQGDRLDLSALGDLAFVGTAAFSGTAGEVRYTRGNSTTVQVDVDGNGIADGAIRLTGNIMLTAGDFIL